MKTFSIIIATYNMDEALAKTLDSILTQGYLSYEVIVIDGSSIDKTPDLLKDYAKKFKGNLSWQSEPDRGIYDAMNKGIDMAAGEWIYFLGSGDYLYDANVLGSVSDFIEKEKIDVVYGNVQLEGTGILSHGRFSGIKLVEKNICHQAIFCKREIFEKTGKFDISYKISADYIFNMKWFNDKSIRHKYIDRIIAVYDTTGASSVAKDQKFESERKEITKRYFSAYVIFLSHIRAFFHRICVVLGFLLQGDFIGLKNRVSDRLKGRNGKI